MTRQVDWTDLGRGDVVLGRDNRAWTFIHRADDGTVWLEVDDEVFQGRPRGQATLVHTAKEAAETAVAVAQVQLGGQVQATRDEQGRWRTPVAFTHPGALAAHIYILHGQLVPEADALSDLVATHEQLHRPDRKTQAHGYVDHVHDPEFYRETE